MRYIYSERVDEALEAYKKDLKEYDSISSELLEEVAKKDKQSSWWYKFRNGDFLQRHNLSYQQPYFVLSLYKKLNLPETQIVDLLARVSNFNYTYWLLKNYPKGDLYNPTQDMISFIAIFNKENK